MLVICEVVCSKCLTGLRQSSFSEYFKIFKATIFKCLTAPAVIQKVSPVLECSEQSQKNICGKHYSQQK